MSWWPTRTASRSCRAWALADVIAAAEAREAKEQAMFEQLRAGATTLDLLSLDPSPVRRA